MAVGYSGAHYLPSMALKVRLGKVLEYYWMKPSGALVCLASGLPRHIVLLQVECFSSRMAKTLQLPSYRLDN